MHGGRNARKEEAEVCGDDAHDAARSRACKASPEKAAWSSLSKFVADGSPRCRDFERQMSPRASLEAMPCCTEATPAKATPAKAPLRTLGKALLRKSWADLTDECSSSDGEGHCYAGSSTVMGTLKLSTDGQVEMLRAIVTPTPDDVDENIPKTKIPPEEKLETCADLQSFPEWTVGAENHLKQSCRPCIFFPKAVGCSSGRECRYCHFGHEPKVRYRRHKRHHQYTSPDTLESAMNGGEAFMIPSGLFSADA